MRIQGPLCFTQVSQEVSQFDWRAATLNLRRQYNDAIALHEFSASAKSVAFFFNQQLIEARRAGAIGALPDRINSSQKKAREIKSMLNLHVKVLWKMFKKYKRSFKKGSQNGKNQP